MLSHQVFDPQLHPRGWGTAGAEIGVHVQSWNAAGGDFQNNAGRWEPVWQRSEANPTGSRGYNGTEDARTIQLDVPAYGDRAYAIWVSCRAFVITGAKFGLDIRASASISCELPFLFVEEVV